MSALNFPLLSTSCVSYSFEGVPESGVGSPRRLVLAPAAATGLATVVAGAQGQIAAHAGCNEGECYQGQPA